MEEVAHLFSTKTRSSARGGGAVSVDLSAVCDGAGGGGGEVSRVEGLREALVLRPAHAGLCALRDERSHCTLGSVGPRNENNESCRLNNFIPAITT